jgi:rhodanese-related sulfurtransferase
MNAFGLALFLAACVRTQAPSGDDFYAGPYCGLYSVHTCLKLAGKNVDFDKLACMKYKADYEGSTALELERALEDHGVRALARANLSAEYLRRINNPVILHARQPGVKSPYEHWLLFLGCEGASFCVLDPPKRTVFKVSPAELLAIWDGSGIVAEVRSSGEVLAYTATMLVYLIVLLSGGVVSLLLALCVRRWKRGVGSALSAQAAGAFLLAFGFHLLVPVGFARNSSAVAMVGDNHFQAPVETITERAILSRGALDPVLIDTRLERHYARGTIPGAVNLPITANYFERTIFLRNLPRDKPMVVFCQSERCPWSRRIASYLKWRGYGQTYVYSPGYAGWQEAQQKPSQP